MKKVARFYRLTVDTVAKLEMIAKQTKRSRTAVIETLISNEYDKQQETK